MHRENLPDDAEAERDKTAGLARLAAQGFQQLDQGLGTEIHGKHGLETFIARIGMRASKPRRARKGGK